MHVAMGQAEPVMSTLQVPFSIPFPHQPRNSYSTSLGNICFGTSLGNICFGTSCGYNITTSLDGTEREHYQPCRGRLSVYLWATKIMEVVMPQSGIVHMADVASIWLFMWCTCRRMEGEGGRK